MTSVVIVRIVPKRLFPEFILIVRLLGSKRLEYVVRSVMAVDAIDWRMDSPNESRIELPATASMESATDWRGGELEIRGEERGESRPD